MLKIIVLGVAAGGGFPQWNCNCTGCQAARANPALREGQASLAVSADGDNWFLINASPDLRSQILDTPALAPRPGHLRDSPIAGVILTNGEVDAVTGLLSLREGSPFGIWGHERVLSVLRDNAIFNVLHPDLVTRTPVALDVPFRPHLPDGRDSGLEITAYEVPGKPAWYLEGTAADTGETPGDTLGLHIRAREGGESLHVVAAAGRVTPALAARLDGADLVFFDGTLWTDDEMIRQGLHTKTGQRMGHISVSGQDGAMAALAPLDIGRRMFLHINNSNPILRPDSPERAGAEAEGWEIPHAGQEIAL